MKFGRVDNPELVDFSFPEDHPENRRVLQASGFNGRPNIYVGCSKWTRADMKGFYPRGTKDELTYYATQFNSIELNTTFYQFYPTERFEIWKNKTPDHFRFFPKVNQTISHLKKLNQVGQYTEEFCHALAGLGEKLGSVFLQLHNDFGPNYWSRLEQFLRGFPQGVPLAVEVRQTDWLNDPAISNRYFELLEALQMATVITDTPGRRDLVHMRLTAPWVMVRFVWGNHKSDYTRLDDWFDRIKLWSEHGIKDIYFFVHQDLDEAYPLLSSYFINRLNKELGHQLHVPTRQPTQTSLF